MINEAAVAVVLYAPIVLVCPWRSRGREGGMFEGDIHNLYNGMRCVHMETFATRALVKSAALWLHLPLW